MINYYKWISLNNVNAKVKIYTFYLKKKDYFCFWGTSVSFATPSTTCRTTQDKQFSISKLARNSITKTFAQRPPFSFTILPLIIQALQPTHHITIKYKPHSNRNATSHNTQHQLHGAARVRISLNHMETSACTRRDCAGDRDLHIERRSFRRRCRVARGCRPVRADGAGFAGETPSIRRTRAWRASSRWSRAAGSPGSPTSRAAPSWSPRGTCTSRRTRSRRCRLTWVRGRPTAYRSPPPPRRPAWARGARLTGARRRDAPPLRSWISRYNEVSICCISILLLCRRYRSNYYDFAFI